MPFNSRLVLGRSLARIVLSVPLLRGEIERSRSPTQTLRGQNLSQEDNDKS